MVVHLVHDWSLLSFVVVVINCWIVFDIRIHPTVTFCGRTFVLSSDIFAANETFFSVLDNRLLVFHQFQLPTFCEVDFKVRTIEPEV